MKLRTLKFHPRGTNGWQSETLIFGDEITQLYGPNGCGKTPLIQSISFCLGFPAKFREDIYANCSHAALEFEIDNDVYSVTRAFSTDMDITLTNPVGEQHSFFNEKDYSEYLFKVLKLPFPTLVTNTSKASTPFISSILPIFYLDQDDGYSGFYCPPSSFIKDQFAETMRLLLGLPVKNSFDLKKDALDAKRELEFLDKLVVTRSKELEVATANAPQLKQPIEEINKELLVLRANLEDLRGPGQTQSASVDALDEIIARAKTSARDLARELEDINKRNKSITQITSEIEIEINTLNLNEEAKRVFSAFDEICSSSGCQMFSFSTESYGKNLLYLRDQIKDLDRNREVSIVRYETLLQQQNQSDQNIKNLIEKRNSLLKENQVGALVEAITQITSRVFKLELDKKELEQVEELKKRYFDILMKRDQAIDKFESFSNTGVPNENLIKARYNLKNNFLRWLDILDTNNISHEITFKDDFVPVLGTENLSQLKGSTKIRVVLAYHAAVIETLINANRHIFNFLILDTPKQHEMHDVDLSRYLNELKNLSHKENIQIVFSATEYRHIGNHYDMEWLPKFQGKKQKMFLEDLGS